MSARTPSTDDGARLSISDARSRRSGSRGTANGSDPAESPDRDGAFGDSAGASGSTLGRGGGLLSLRAATTAASVTSDADSRRDSDAESGISGGSYRHRRPKPVLVPAAARVQEVKVEVDEQSHVSQQSVRSFHSHHSVGANGAGDNDMPAAFRSISPPTWRGSGPMFTVEDRSLGFDVDVDDRVCEMHDDQLEGLHVHGWVAPWYNTQQATSIILMLLLAGAFLPLSNFFETLHPAAFVGMAGTAMINMTTLGITLIVTHRCKLAARRVGASLAAVRERALVGGQPASSRTVAAELMALMVPALPSSDPPAVQSGLLTPSRQEELARAVSIDAAALVKLDRARSLLLCIFVCSWTISQHALLPLTVCGSTDIVRACDALYEGSISVSYAAPVVVGLIIATIVYRMRVRHIVVPVFLGGVVSPSIPFAIIVSKEASLTEPALFTMTCVALAMVTMSATRSRSLRERITLRNLVLMVKSISESRSAEARARKAERAAVDADLMRRTSQNAASYSAHELRNPVHQLANILDPIVKSSGIPDDIMEDLIQARSVVTHMSSICSDALDLQKLAVMGGAFELHPAPMTVADVLQEQLALHVRRREEAGEETVVGSVSVAEDVPAQVVIDPNRFIQLVSNGISNAIKHVGTDRSIHVTASFSTTRTMAVPPGSRNAAEPGAFLRVEVRNKGRGLSKVDVPRLFEPFTQSEKSDVSVRVRGTGLGLPICRMLSRVMGGDVQLYDDRDTRWTVFALELPVQVPSSGGAGAAHGDDTGRRGRMMRAVSRDVDALPQQLRLAVVDDERVNRRVVMRMAKTLGCTCDEFLDGADVDVEAIAREGKYDALLLDIVMPEIGGDVLCERLRAAGVTIPLIATTGNTAGDDIARYLSVGFTTVLTKPFSVRDLGNTLRELFRLDATPRRPTSRGSDVPPWQEDEADD